MHAVMQMQHSTHLRSPDGVGGWPDLLAAVHPFALQFVALVLAVHGTVREGGNACMSREPGTGQLTRPSHALLCLRFSQIRSTTGVGEGGAASPALD